MGGPTGETPLGLKEVAEAGVRMRNLGRVGVGVVITVGGIEAAAWLGLLRQLAVSLRFDCHVEMGMKAPAAMREVVKPLPRAGAHRQASPSPWTGPVRCP